MPRFKKHIISVSRLCRDGYEITITDQECRIKTVEGGYIAIKKSKDGMFYLDVLRNQKRLIMSTMEMEASIKLKIDRRLGAGLLESEFD